MLMLQQNADLVSNSAVIVPIGEVDSVLLLNLVKVLEQRFNISFKIKEPFEIPEDAFNPNRGQYHSPTMLEKLQHYKEKKVLGIIDKDLYVPELNFVFGQADSPGRYALISITRLRQEFYGLPKDDNIFFDRVIKEAVHELGHTYGLRHCSNPECVMFFSNSLLDTDRKSSSFCKICFKKINK